MYVQKQINKTWNNQKMRFLDSSVKFRIQNSLTLEKNLFFPHFPLNLWEPRLGQPRTQYRLVHCYTAKSKTIVYNSVYINKSEAEVFTEVSRSSSSRQRYLKRCTRHFISVTARVHLARLTTTRSCMPRGLIP